MSIFLRLTFHAVLMLGIVVILGYCQPDWLQQAGLDFWSLPRLERALQGEIQRQDQLERHARRLQARCARKSVILHQLIQGNISLQQATEQISQLTEPSVLEVAVQFSENLRGDTFRECVGWLVITMALREMASQPERRRVVRQRLEAEWERDILPAASSKNAAGVQVARGN